VRPCECDLLYKVMVGGDVLVVSGNAFFTGCSFTSTMLFG
jgi:hypothetical protein